MVTLFCFCCSHHNPSGARFCNACGTPLHLKPCRQCETINDRAAAHCHKCGETFALEFLALDPEPVADPTEAAQPSPPPVSVGDAPDARSRRLPARVVALVGGLAAATLLSAYYAYRQPDLGPVAASVASPAQPVAAPPALVSVTPDPAPVSQPVPLGEPPGPAIRGGASRTAKEVNGSKRLDGAKVPRSQERALPTVKRDVQASAGKPPAEPRRRQARPSATEPVASGLPAIGAKADEDRFMSAANPIALQQAVATPPPLPARAAPADIAPVQRPRESARPPAPVTGRWDRPCAEGVALDSNCDVRTMPKGN